MQTCSTGITELNILTEGVRMNDDRLEGNWKQLRGKVQEQWGKLTNDDLDEVAGRRDQLIGKIQAQYGKSKDEAKREVDAYIDRL